MPPIVSRILTLSDDAILDYDGCHLASIELEDHRAVEGYVNGYYAGNPDATPTAVLHSLSRFLKPEGSMTQEQFGSLVTKNGCDNLVGPLIRGIEFIQNNHNYDA